VSDLARRLLDQRKEDARARGDAPGSSASPDSGPDSRRFSGPGADPRDPRRLVNAVADLVRDRGWGATVEETTVSACWDRLVGADVAAHCQPQRLVDGELTVVAESTAWATQLRMLSGTLVSRLAEQLGAGLVRSVRVVGPTAPSWSRGPRRVRGRGPRDTYG
jgi:predicted nucleic acid-binding Zn ribbon protein